MATKLPSWQLQTAKNRFSDLVDQALSSGPQLVTRHGRETAVVLAFDDYQALTGKKKPKRSFIETLLAAPRVRGGLNVTRSADLGRDVDLE